MFKSLLRDCVLVFLLLLVLLLRLFSLNVSWVEKYYTFGFYPVVSHLLRVLFGWLPFSLGDVVYLLAVVWLLLKIWKFILLLKHKQARAHFTWAVFRKYLKIVLGMYLVFSLFWGLNYYQRGITQQLGIELKPYSTQDLFALTTCLEQRLIAYAGKVDSVQRLHYNQNKYLFAEGEEAYRSAIMRYPFLRYVHPSIKPSLLTPVGNWFGFTGYYNPFTAEAQLKTDIPVFLKPFVVTHEMAHQLGYARENEANFVGYLTCKESGNVDFLYSAYFELYRDAIVECTAVPGNEQLLKNLWMKFPDRVRNDVYDLHLYFLRSRNFIEPFMSGAYESYLKLNNQPKGHATYSEVIAYLIAYMKKFGKESI